jgi:hypothetical protein
MRKGADREEKKRGKKETGGEGGEEKRGRRKGRRGRRKGKSGRRRIQRAGLVLRTRGI